MLKHCIQKAVLIAVIIIFYINNLCVKIPALSKDFYSILSFLDKMVWNFPDNYFMFMLIVILFIIIFITFYIIKKIKQKKQRPKKTAQKIIENSKENLLLLDKKIKNYFKRYLKLDSEIGYTKIAEKLREKNKYALADFCERMNYSLYSGEKIDEEDIKALNKHFYSITRIKKSKKKKTERKSKK